MNIIAKGKASEGYELRRKCKIHEVDVFEDDILESDSDSLLIYQKQVGQMLQTNKASMFLNVAFELVPDPTSN